MNRRRLLRQSLMGLGVSPFLFTASVAKSAPRLQPTNDLTTGLPLIKLPEGFSYRTMSWTGDVMAQSSVVPDRHDGMCVVPGATESQEILLRNHERSYGVAFGGETCPTYDSFITPDDLSRRIGFRLGSAGGVTEVVIQEGAYAGTNPLLAGTLVNCAGGVTPWGTWLTCEEILFRGSNLKLPDGTAAKDHGYVFEVPPGHMGPASAVPIKDMGFFRHEAVAVVKETSSAYLTEDNGPNSGFYKFVPHDKSGKLGSLEQGGKLHMLKVMNRDRVNLTSTDHGVAFDVEWVPIDDPDSDPEGLNSYGEGLKNLVGTGRSGPYLDGEAKGGAQFSRLEGIWEYDGRLYFVDTAGGPASSGSVWVYDPKSERLLCIYASKSEDESDAVDNITVNHLNGMYVLCEDGGGVHNADQTLKYGCRMLVGEATKQGVTVIAENNLELSSGVPERPAIEPKDYRGGEWAGAVFSKDGKTLYANLQVPGITVAIQGPWSSLLPV